MNVSNLHCGGKSADIWIFPGFSWIFLGVETFLKLHCQLLLPLETADPFESSDGVLILLISAFELVFPFNKTSRPSLIIQSDGLIILHKRIRTAVDDLAGNVMNSKYHASCHPM